MTIQGQPVWPFQPDWSASVLESLEWLTTILTSPSGAEQRRSLRYTPRQYLEYTTIVYDEERSLFDNMLTAFGSRDFYLPLWYDPHIATASGSFLECSTAIDGEFQIGLAAWVVDDLGGQIADVIAVSAAGLTLGPLGRPLAGILTVWPVRTAYLVEQPTAGRRTDRGAQVQVKFQIRDIDARAAGDLVDRSGLLPLHAYKGLYVLTERPDESSSLDYVYSRSVTEFDNKVFTPTRIDISGLGSPTQQHRWVFTGRTEVRNYKNMLFALRGRAYPFWMPTFFSDFIPIDDILAGNIRAKQCGYSQYLGPSVRPDIMIELTNGGILVDIVVSSELIDGIEHIKLAPNDMNISMNDILQICFVQKSRMDQDLFEIEHTTDLAGVTKATAVIRGVPKDRSPA